MKTTIVHVVVSGVIIRDTTKKLLKSCPGYSPLRAYLKRSGVAGLAYSHPKLITIASAKCRKRPLFRLCLATQQVIRSPHRQTKALPDCIKRCRTWL